MSSSITQTPPAINTVQVTLVDCPGHASLIRTIIGGAHIIDLVLLVIDVTRGIQAQTVECVIIAEITTKNMIIVLNKVKPKTEGSCQHVFVDLGERYIHT